ncbi:MAG: rod shape-determining protein MreD [Ignavibacteria bacterium]|nr:rod shape-determining protein MreD [Ignavibacteria bacterium]MBI3766196.1 rod shape-determining protein MreD [Ignavibacteriales bacterium]
MSRHVKYVFITILLTVIQTQLMRLLTLEGITPDILTIWIVYIALREGQLPATVWGFGIGLFFDLVTGNFVGLSALTKTICGFIAGYFYNENKTSLTLGSYRFIVIVLIVSLIHNTVYFIIFTQGSNIGLVRAVLQLGFATTCYTATLTLLPMFAFARKYIS